MTYAIVTKFLGATRRLPPRIRARGDGLACNVRWNMAESIEANHVRAAETFARRKGWHGAWIAAELPGVGMVFVSAGKPAFTVEESM